MAAQFYSDATTNRIRNSDHLSDSFSMSPAGTPSSYDEDANCGGSLAVSMMGDCTNLCSSTSTPLAPSQSYSFLSSLQSANDHCVVQRAGSNLIPYDCRQSQATDVFPPPPCLSPHPRFRNAVINSDGNGNVRSQSDHFAALFRDISTPAASSAADTVLCLICDEPTLLKHLTEHLHKDFDYFPISCKKCPKRFFDLEEFHRHCRITDHGYEYITCAQQSLTDVIYLTKCLCCEKNDFKVKYALMTSIREIDNNRLPSATTKIALTRLQFVCGDKQFIPENKSCLSGGGGLSLLANVSCAITEASASVDCKVPIIKDGEIEPCGIPLDDKLDCNALKKFANVSDGGKLRRFVSSSAILSNKRKRKHWLDRVHFRNIRYSSSQLDTTKPSGLRRRSRILRKTTNDASCSLLRKKEFVNNGELSQTNLRSNKLKQISNDVEMNVANENSHFDGIASNEMETGTETEICAEGSRAVIRCFKPVILHYHTYPDKCSICDYKCFKKRGKEKDINHVWSHIYLSGDEPLKCTKCTESFITPQLLSNHLRKQHGLKGNASKLLIQELKAKNSELFAHVFQQCYPWVYIPKWLDDKILFKDAENPSDLSSSHGTTTRSRFILQVDKGQMICSNCQYDFTVLSFDSMQYHVEQALFENESPPPLACPHSCLFKFQFYDVRNIDYHLKTFHKYDTVSYNWLKNIWYLLALRYKEIWNYCFPQKELPPDLIELISKVDLDHSDVGQQNDPVKNPEFEAKLYVQCAVCKHKRFSKSDDCKALKRHVWTQINYILVCDICRQEFSYYGNLIKHFVQLHGIEENQIQQYMKETVKRMSLLYTDQFLPVWRQHFPVIPIPPIQRCTYFEISTINQANDIAHGIGTRTAEKYLEQPFVEQQEIFIDDLGNDVSGWVCFIKKEIDTSESQSVTSTGTPIADNIFDALNSSNSNLPDMSIVKVEKEASVSEALLSCTICGAVCNGATNIASHFQSLHPEEEVSYSVAN